MTNIQLEQIWLVKNISFSKFLDFYMEMVYSQSVCFLIFFKTPLMCIPRAVVCSLDVYRLLIYFVTGLQWKILLGLGPGNVDSFCRLQTPDLHWTSIRRVLIWLCLPLQGRISESGFCKTLCRETFIPMLYCPNWVTESVVQSCRCSEDHVSSEGIGHSRAVGIDNKILLHIKLIQSCGCRGVSS